MMLHLLCHMLLLIFLSGGGVVLVKASNNAISCGYDVNCQAIVKTMAAVDEIKSKLDEQGSRTEVNVKLDKLATNVHDIQGKQMKDAEMLLVNMNKSLSSTAAVSTQLEKHSANLLSHDEHLKKIDLLLTNMNQLVQSVNEKLDKLATNVLDKQAKDVELLGKQAKVLEDMKEKLDRSPASTAAALSTQFERISKDLLSHDERLKAHDVSQTNLYRLVQSIHDAQLRPRDCSDIRGSSVSGVHRVYPGDAYRAMEVYCDFKTVGQSWLVFQRRKDGSVDFNRNWNDYANGFGALTGEFWLGDSLTSHHNNVMFSTKDSDNDGNSGHCAQSYPGGWWFNTCHHSNLNGQYLKGPHSQAYKGVLWFYWKGANYSLKTAEMKITAV